MPFLSNEEGSSSYQDLIDAVYRASNSLEAEPRGVLVIEGDYSVEATAWMLAGLAFGWRVVPIVSNNSDIVESRIRISRASHRVSLNTSWCLRLISNSDGATDLDDAGVVLFSSGSTGEPKAMCKSLDISINDQELRLGRQTNMALLLLFDHIGGLNTLLSGMRKGSHFVAPKERNPTVMARLMQTHSVSVLPCSPTFLNMMYLDGVFEEYDLSSLRMVTYGTERMPEELLKKVAARLPKVKFLQTFGTSETGIVKTKSFSSNSTFFTIDDPDVAWKVVDDELWIRTNSQIDEYLNTEEEVLSEGWFKTGDLVEVKEGAYFRIIGRKKQVINVGGEKVLPSEIEDLINTIPLVEDCTAYAVDNAITGQSVGVTILTSRDADTSSLKRDIRSLTGRTLERYKIPTKINFEFEVKYTDRFKKER
jgi:acyl-CoA synthetase (AMP-forming)/AMP-acid ligase II